MIFNKCNIKKPFSFFLKFLDYANKEKDSTFNPSDNPVLQDPDVPIVTSTNLELNTEYSYQLTPMSLEEESRNFEAEMRTDLTDFNFVKNYHMNSELEKQEVHSKELEFQDDLEESDHKSDVSNFNSFDVPPNKIEKAATSNNLELTDEFEQFSERGIYFLLLYLYLYIIYKILTEILFVNNQLNIISIRLIQNRCYLDCLVNHR